MLGNHYKHVNYEDYIFFKPLFNKNNPLFESFIKRQEDYLNSYLPFRSLLASYGIEKFIKLGETLGERFPSAMRLFYSPSNEFHIFYLRKLIENPAILDNLDLSKIASTFKNAEPYLKHLKNDEERQIWLDILLSPHFVVQNITHTQPGLINVYQTHLKSELTIYLNTIDTTAPLDDIKTMLETGYIPTTIWNNIKHKVFISIITGPEIPFLIKPLSKLYDEALFSMPEDINDNNYGQLSHLNRNIQETFLGDIEDAYYTQALQQLKEKTTTTLNQYGFFSIKPGTMVDISKSFSSLKEGEKITPPNYGNIKNKILVRLEKALGEHKESRSGETTTFYKQSQYSLICLPLPKFTNQEINQWLVKIKGLLDEANQSALKN